MIKEITYIIDIALQNVLLGFSQEYVLQEFILEIQATQKCRCLLLEFKKHNS